MPCKNWVTNIQEVSGEEEKKEGNWEKRKSRMINNPPKHKYLPRTKFWVLGTFIDSFMKHRVRSF